MENKKRAKKQASDKVSELHFKIKMLESKECLSSGEISRLNNLREMENMQIELGINVKKSVPVGVLKKFMIETKSADDTEVGNNDDGDHNENLEPSASPESIEHSEPSQQKKKRSNVFNYYVSEMKKQHKVDFPKASFDMNEVSKSWKALPTEQKLRYKLMSKQVVEKVDENNSEVNQSLAKERKKERDRNYVKALAVRRNQEKNEKEHFIKDFERILLEKRSKVEHLREKKNVVRKEISMLVAESEVVQKMITEKDKEELALKSELRSLFSHHKICKK